MKRSLFVRMSRQELLRYIREQQGGQTQAQYAEKLGVTDSYLSQVYKGRLDPGPKLIKALGLEREVSYLRWR